MLVVADYARSMDDIWAEIPEPLAAQSRVCAYDRLGVGRSDPAPDRQTLASMADDLGGVITALGMKRPVVVGHALGGAIVLTWASARTADARALVLLDPMPPGYFGPGRALEKALPPRDPGDLDLSNLWADIDEVNDPVRNTESLDPASWTAYERLTAVSLPLYVAVEEAIPSWPASVDRDKVAATYREHVRRVLALSPRAEQVLVPTPDAWPTVLRSTVARALQS